MPKASCSWNDCRIAWPAGQKKNRAMTVTCGASSTQGSHEDRKRTRFSAAKFLFRSTGQPLPSRRGGWEGSETIGQRLTSPSGLVSLLELLELFIPALDHRGQG